MNKLKTTLVIATIIATAFPLMAQHKRVSPHETITAEIDGAKISIVYGRPYTKDPKTGEARKVWGKLVPFGKVWRTGADEATLLITDQPIVLGTATISAGTNSLFTLPVESGTSKLIINKKTGQWGIPYKEKEEEQNELARVDLQKAALDKPVDQFTMAVEKNPAGGGVIKLTWESTEYSVPFTVKK
jgi:hypothetical protein